jgi:hypothetical protein
LAYPALDSPRWQSPARAFGWGVRSVGSTVLSLVLFATYLGIGALAHDTHFSLGWALAMYARAIKRLSAVIGDQDPSLLSTLMRTRGTRTFYQVRIGADTRPRPTISVTASAAPAAPVLCCETGCEGMSGTTPA